MEKVGVGAEVQREILNAVSEKLRETNAAYTKLQNEVAKVPEAGAKETAEYYRSTVVKAMEELRKPVDELEMLVDKRVWPMPSYGDMMFNV